MMEPNAIICYSIAIKFIYDYVFKYCFMHVQYSNAIKMIGKQLCLLLSNGIDKPERWLSSPIVGI